MTRCRFWFRFLYGSADRYDRFGDETYERLVGPEMADFVAAAFEQLCCEALWTLYGETPIVDVVVLTDEETLGGGECNDQESPLDYGALASLA